MAYGTAETISMLFALNSTDATGWSKKNAGNPTFVNNVIKFSYLHEGLTRYISRLLRPVWYKHMVNVEAGKKNRKNVMSEDKVYLQLDENTLQAVLSPLADLVKHLRDEFRPAVYFDAKRSAVVQNNPNGAVAGNLTGGILSFNSTGLGSVGGGQNGIAMSNPTDLEHDSINKLYRLVSRSAQLLSLLSKLQQCASEKNRGTYPNIKWSKISGVYFKDLVCSEASAKNIKELLRDLTLSSSVSAPADELSQFLHKECYMFYSLGDKLTQEGFQWAEHARAQNGDIQIAGITLRKAASWWNQPSDVDNANSAFMRSTKLLFDARSYGGIGFVVDVCVKVASNFGGTVKGTSGEEDDDINVAGSSSLTPREQQERLLYHKEENQGANAAAGAIIVAGAGAVGQPAQFLTQAPREKCYEVMFGYLKKLVDEGEILADVMISHMVSSEDEILHERLYHWLLVNDQKDFLIRIKTNAHLKKFLLARDPDVLWKHYVHHGNQTDASQLMSTRACSTNRVRLDLRIQCFTRVNPVDAENKGKLEVARLQKLVLEDPNFGIKSLIQRGELSGQDALRAQEDVEYKLLSPSEMFNNYAQKYGMWEVCLSIMQECEYRQMDKIESLWMSMLCECLPYESSSDDDVTEYLHTLKGQWLSRGMGLGLNGGGNAGVAFDDFDSGAWIDVTRKKIIEVGSRHYRGIGKEYIVPLGKLVNELEALKGHWERVRNVGLREKENNPWVISVFEEIGVEYDDLLDVYIQVFHDRGSLTATNGGRLDLLKGIVQIIDKWIRYGDGETLKRALAQGLRSKMDGVSEECEKLVGNWRNGETNRDEEVEYLQEVLKDDMGYLR
jgi:hypothetical protein